MGNIGLFLFLTMSFIWRIDSKDIYLITTPNILLSETLHKFNTFVTTNAALIIETIHLSSNIANRTNIILLEKGHRSIPYFVPFTGPYIGSSLELRFLADKCASIKDCQSLTNIKGTFINESRQIDIIVDNFIIFSETDKPIYKPGDLVKLRAMAIYPTNLMLEPLSTGQYVEILLNNGKYHSVPTIRRQRVTFSSITIQSPDNVKIAQWRNVSFEKAMRLNFSLSKDAMLGQWKITTVLSLKVDKTFFIVKKYVLPTFNVDVYPPSNIFLSDTAINFKVCAFYNNGKNIFGFIKGELCLTIKKMKCRPFLYYINGSSKCTELSFKSELFGFGEKKKYFPDEMSFVTVSVTDNRTLVKVTKHISGFIVKWNFYKIQLESKPYIKSGLPYIGKVKLSRHDGTPQTNTKVLISINWGPNVTYISNNDGIIDFVIPYIPPCRSLTLIIQGEDDINDIMTTPIIVKYLEVRNSEENLQIMPLKEEVKCPGTVALELLMNGDVSIYTVYAQIISRGVINKIIEYPPIPNKCYARDDYLGHYECAENNQLKCLKGFQGRNCRIPSEITKLIFQQQSIFERYIDIPIEKNMGPDLQIIVYYINNNNEVFADSLENIKGLKNCSHLGGGKFQFNKNTTIPGEIVTLTIDPNTKKRNCAVRISEVSTSEFEKLSNMNLDYLINKLTELNNKSIIENLQGPELERCLQGNSFSSFNYLGFEQGYDTKNEFLQSGTTLIPNTIVKNAKCIYYYLSERYNKQNDIIFSKSKNFPETWIFEYYEETPTQLNFTVPDSSTSWKANSFCMTEKGIWMSPSRYLTVLLPFSNETMNGITPKLTLKPNFKPKLPVLIQCPKCFNDSEKSVFEFISKTCSTSFTGIMKSNNNTLNNRLFYESRNSSEEKFYEWTVNEEHSNCTCWNSWSYINDDFVVISSELLNLDKNLTFNNNSLFFPMNVVYKAFSSDLSKSCYAAEELSLTLSKHFLEFSDETDVVDTCSLCITSSNMYYKVKNISEFICSNNSRWSLNMVEINDFVVLGSINNIFNETMSVSASFPASSCYCLSQLNIADKDFLIIDLNETIPTMNNFVNETIQIYMDDNFQLVESKVYTTYKATNCDY